MSGRLFLIWIHMQKSTLLFLLLLFSAYAFHLGRQRSRQIVDGKVKTLHSLPNYYGFYTALWCGLPALLLLLLWLGFESPVINHFVIADLPEELRSLPADRQSLLINDLKNSLNGTTSETKPGVQAAVEHMRSLRSQSNWLLTVLGQPLWGCWARCLPVRASTEISAPATRWSRQSWLSWWEARWSPS